MVFCILKNVKKYNKSKSIIKGKIEASIFILMNNYSFCMYAIYRKRSSCGGNEAIIITNVTYMKKT